MHEFNVAKLQSMYTISVSNYHGVFVRNNDDVQTRDSIARTALNWLEKEKSLERVERVINHFHVYDLLLNITEDEYDSIAVKIFSCWNEALKKIDPAFRVEKYEDYGPTITFYKKRDG